MSELVIFDPVLIMRDVFCELYPGTKGGVVRFRVDASMPYFSALELLAYDLASLAVGTSDKAQHKEAFNKIYDLTLERYAEAMTHYGHGFEGVPI